LRVHECVRVRGETEEAEEEATRECMYRCTMSRQSQSRYAAAVEEDALSVYECTMSKAVEGRSGSRGGCVECVVEEEALSVYR